MLKFKRPMKKRASKKGKFIGYGEFMAIASLLGFMIFLIIYGLSYTN